MPRDRDGHLIHWEDHDRHPLGCDPNHDCVPVFDGDGDNVSTRHDDRCPLKPLGTQ